MPRNCTLCDRIASRMWVGLFLVYTFAVVVLLTAAAVSL